MCYGYNQEPYRIVLVTIQASVLGGYQEASGQNANGRGSELGRSSPWNFGVELERTGSFRRILVIIGPEFSRKRDHRQHKAGTRT